MSRSFRFLEHTADIGIHAAGDTLEEAFAAAADGLSEILGAAAPGEGEDRDVLVEAEDREALLVSWIDELLYLQESLDAVFGGFDVQEIGESDLRAIVRVGSRRGRRLEGQHVKAATYHRVRVGREGGGWAVEVYLDV